MDGEGFLFMALHMHDFVNSNTLKTWLMNHS